MVWPMDESTYGPVEFEGIVSETLMRTLDKRTGATRLMWRKINRANEPLDVLVYSLALVSHLGLGFMLAEADAIAQRRRRTEGRRMSPFTDIDEVFFRHREDLFTRVSPRMLHRPASRRGAPSPRSPR